MMTTQSRETMTPNLNLVKPGYDDHYDVDKFNHNAEIIDSKFVSLYNDATVTGSVVEFDDSIDGRVKEIEIFGESEQNGEPSPTSPSEIEVVEGVTNLLSVTKWYSYTYSNALPFAESSSIIINSSNGNNVNFSVNANAYLQVISNPIQLKPNATYTLRYDRIDSKVVTTRYYIYNYSNGTYTINNWATDGGTGLSYTFSTDSNGQIVIGFGVNNTAIGVTCDITDIQIEEGSIVHPYVPYGNWLSVNSSSKNLFDSTIEVGDISTANGINMDIANTNYSRSIDYYRVDSNQTYRITAPTNITQVVVYEYDASKTYLGFSVTNSYTHKFTTKRNCRFIRYRVRTTDITTKVEIYKENVSYIDMNKPNLLDLQYLKLLTDTSGNTITNTNAYNMIIDVSNISALYVNTTRFDLISDNAIRVGLYDENPALGIKGTREANISSTNNIVKTKGKKYVLLSYLLSKSNYEEIKDNSYVYEGYEPYYTLDKIGNIQDRLYLQNGHAYLEKNIGKVVLDGSENWTQSSTNTSSIHRIRYAGLESIIKKGSTNEISNILCSHLKANSAADNYKLNQGIAIDGSGDILIYIDGLNTLNDYKTWLSEHHITVYYELENPQIIDLGEATMPVTFYPTTRMYVMDNLEPQINVKYFQDFRILLKNLQEQIAALTTQNSSIEEE